MQYRLSKNFSFIKDVKLQPQLVELENHFRNKEYERMPLLARKIIERIFIEELGYKETEKLNDHIFRFKESFEDPFAVDALHHIKKWGNIYAHYKSKSILLEDFNFTNALYLIKSVSVFLKSIFQQDKPRVFSAIPYLEGTLSIPSSKDKLLEQSITADELKIRKKSIVSLLKDKNTILKIPFYQRNYTWNEGQITTFLEDLKLRNSDRNQHYFGVIATKRKIVDENVLIKIIDGQQRLTTSILFLKAAYNNIERRGLKRISFLDEIFEENSLDERYVNESGKEGALKEFRQILKTTNPLGLEWRYGKNYKQFYNFFDNEKSRQNIYDLVSVFTTKFEIVELEYEVSPSREMDIFENMNSKGTELKEWDLIRNHIFNSISSIAQIHDNDKVSIMEGEFEFDFNDDIKEDKKEDELAKFFKEFLYFKLINEKKHFVDFDRFPIYNNFKKYFKQQINSVSEYKRFLNELHSLGTIYKSLYKKNTNILNNELESIFLRWKNIASKQQFYFVIFKIFRVFCKWNGKKWILSDNKSILNIIKLIDSLLIRIEVCKGFGHTLRNAAIDFFKKINLESWEIDLKELIYNSPLLNVSNDDFSHSLLNTKLKVTLVGKILLELENFLIQKSNQKVQKNSTKIVLEHIMPKENEKWKKYLSNLKPNWEDYYQKTLSMLGNIYILPASKKLQSKISNQDFDTKKKKLLEIGSPLIQGSKDMNLISLGDINNWTFDLIEERSNAIVKILMNHVYKI